MSKKNNGKSEIILQAAKGIFAEVGYHNATISKIAKNAGVGDGTVYLYFENKEDILITLFHKTIYIDFVPSIKKSLEHYDDAKILLFELILSHFKFFGADEDLARVIQIESRQSSNIIREAMKPGMVSYFRLIESIVKKGQEQQVFRTDISPRDCRKFIFGGLDEVVTCWILSSKKYSLVKKVEPTYKVFSQMLSSNHSFSNFLF